MPLADDTCTLDAILAALYEVISGPAGRVRDWSRFESLFHPELGRLLPVRPEDNGRCTILPKSPAEYAAHATPIFRDQSFFEVEACRIEERFGHIAHVFSTYEARRDPAEPKPFPRGINRIQRLWDEERWWIVSVFWDAETNAQPLPERYTP